jgi:hypothetical protein
MTINEASKLWDEMYDRAQRLRDEVESQRDHREAQVMSTGTVDDIDEDAKWEALNEMCSAIEDVENALGDFEEALSNYTSADE